MFISAFHVNTAVKFYTMTSPYSCYKTEAIASCKTSVNTCNITGNINPEDQYLNMNNIIHTSISSWMTVHTYIFAVSSFSEV